MKTIFHQHQFISDSYLKNSQLYTLWITIFTIRPDEAM